jgi:hypothetical protein
MKDWNFKWYEYKKEVFIKKNIIYERIAYYLQKCSNVFSMRQFEWHLGKYSAIPQLYDLREIQKKKINLSFNL